MPAVGGGRGKSQASANGGNGQRRGTKLPVVRWCTGRLARPSGRGDHRLGPIAGRREARQRPPAPFAVLHLAPHVGHARGKAHPWAAPRPAAPLIAHLRVPEQGSTGQGWPGACRGAPQAARAAETREAGRRGLCPSAAAHNAYQTREASMWPPFAASTHKSVEMEICSAWLGEAWR